MSILQQVKTNIQKLTYKAGFGNLDSKETIENTHPVASFEDGFIVFKNGTVAKGYVVSNVEMEKWEQGAYNSLNKVFENALSFLPKNTIIQKLDVYYEDRKPTPEQPDNFFESKYYSHFMERPFYNHLSYLFITSPLKAKKQDETTNDYVQYKNIKIEENLKDIEVVKTQWTQVCSEFEMQLNSIDGIKFKPSKDEENENLYNSMFNMEFRYENPKAYKTIENEGNYLVVGDTKLNIISLIGQAKEVDETRISSNGVVAPFTYNIGIFYQSPHIVSRLYKVLNTEKQLKKLDIAVNINTSNPFSKDGAEKAAEIKELTQEIRTGQGTLLEFSLTVGLLSKGEKRRIEANIEMRGEILSWEGAEITVESYNNMIQFFGMLPGNGSQSVRWILMPSKIAMCYNDFTTNVLGTEDGELVADRFRNIIKFKLYNKDLVNQNFILLGPSGSGKSFTMGHLILQRYLKGIRQIILDVGGTYKQIFDSVGGRFLEYDPEKPISFNPFLVPYNDRLKRYDLSDDKREFIKTLFAYLVTGKELTKEQSAAYQTFIVEYYKHENERVLSGEDNREIKMPCLYNFSIWFQKFYLETRNTNEYFAIWDNVKASNFLLAIEPYTTGSFKDLLNSKAPVDISDELLVCFDLARVKDNKELYPLITMLISELSFDVIRKYPNDIKVFLMDEAWSMLKDEMGDFVGYMYRTLRKNKGQVGIITQGISEIINSSVGKTLINNSETKIILRHTNTKEIENIQTHFGLTDSEIMKLSNVKFAKGARQFFVKQGEFSNVYTLEVPLEEMAVLTSQPDERNHIIKLKDKYMGNINNAIMQWVEDYKENKIKK